MTENGPKKELDVVRWSPPSPADGQVTRTIRLGHHDELDLTVLDPSQQKALLVLAHEKAIERDNHSQRLKTDLTATVAQLNVITKAVADATANGAAATITNTKEDSFGRTEMILGNSAAAQAGKLSRSQQGFGDSGKLWIIMAVIAGVVIVLVTALRR